MCALKSVIITLPAKSLAAKAAPGPSINEQLLGKPGSKLNFTTSILVDKIKMESSNGGLAACGKKQQLQQSAKHMELGDGPIVFKQESHAHHGGSAMRGKKRRLDHLTWEEKLQRKKLKNRVAAQTSRDRKKAKLDELEEAVRLLRESNELLAEECTMLRTQNESLATETKRLKRDNKELAEAKETKEPQVCSTCQARVGCTVPALGSAVSPLNPLQQGGTVQTARPLTLTPSATILLKILTLYLLSKTYLASSKGTTTTSSDSKSWPRAFSERLPPKWRQILLSQMNSPVEKEGTEKLDDPEKMVGETPSYVEADTSCGSLTAEQSHHPAQSIPEVTSATSIPVVPSLALDSSPLPIAIAEQIEIKEEPMHDAEMVYGTYDEATNCITIIYPEEEEATTRLSAGVPRAAPQQHQGSLLLLHSPAHSASYDSMSPASVHSEDTDAGGTSSSAISVASYGGSGKFDCAAAAHSDGGYESHDSPASSVSGPNNNHNNSSALTDLWHESFSELFPSLA